MVVLDFVVTLFQSLFIGYSIKSCIEEKNNVKAAIITLISIIISCDIVKGLFSIDPYYFICISNIFLMLIVCAVYRNQIKRSLTAYSICNILISICIILSSNVVLAIIRMFIPEEYINYELATIVYIPQIILSIYLIKNIKIIQAVYKFIVSEGMEIAVIIIANLLFFIVLFYRITIGDHNQFVENSIQIMFAIGLILLIVYFQKIHNTSKKILALNEALENKNNELRKIKHDYGAQISYLYGLALMERHEDVKKSLKNIIDTNQNTADAVEVRMSEQCTEHKDSLLELALKPAVEKGIHVILEENYDINLIKISEMELYRVVSNIINNAIKAMGEKGLITVKAYELMSKVIIEIGNNGPMISEEKIDSIFKAGYTTKKNNDKSHGYGLSIVKELTEKNSGKISVKSTEEKTVFKICFNMN